MTQDATSASSAAPMSQSSQPRLSGDGWAVMATGTRLWGTVGAAGLMLRAPGPDGHPYVLLQHRAEWTSSPDTWALPGGARDVGESAEAAALRESVEETGIDPTALHIVRSQVLLGCRWIMSFGAIIRANFLMTPPSLGEADISGLSGVTHRSRSGPTRPFLHLPSTV